MWSDLTKKPELIHQLENGEHYKFLKSNLWMDFEKDEWISLYKTYE